MPTRAVKLTKSDILTLYATSRFLGTQTRENLKLSIPFEVYFQDPAVAAAHPEFGFDKDCHVDWEPGLSDGPTSARFAVVDYNSDSDMLAPPAEWDSKKLKFVYDGQVLDKGAINTLQFHQVNTWAILQRALRFFEDSNGLGRRIPWGFEGNRLLVVPHAGYGKNAYYDRRSKSLQFYYFDKDEGQVFTCLSTDIVHHEFGHAVLDGVRPLFNESASVETAAFHEFIGDLTAILIILRNNEFRKRLVRETKGDLSQADRLSGIAEEFGKEVGDRPYLRTATNKLKMSDVRESNSPHKMSQVLTGAMFDILLRLSQHYMKERKRKQSAAQAFWNTIQRMQRMAIQPLDLLPPCDVTFRDYALAVLRTEEISNPRDPYRYRELMIKAFVKRGIFTKDEATSLTGDGYLYDRPRLNVFHHVDQIGASKANAYRFLDDNRDSLKLPANRDIIITDLYHAEKYARQARQLPRQLVLEYAWREDVALHGTRFGRLEGKSTTMLCGGTLVLDENGTVLWLVRKDDNETRRIQFLDDIARRIKFGQLGSALGSERGLLGKSMAPFSERFENGNLHIEITPHLGLDDDDNETQGERQWQPSS
jgi:hypothetical protein